jgi:hypothetical protein
VRAILLLALAVPGLAFGWGFDGHRKLASMMQDPLPTNLCLRSWLLARQSSALQDSACDPDRLRCPGSATCDPLEWPRHFLDVDYANPPSSYPRDFAQAVQQFGSVYAQRNGQVPWRVEEQYQLLVTAFASKNESQILSTLFFFSHYVTDAFSLLHDTKNFDPNGLHSRWESDLFQPNANLNGIATLASSTYFGTVGKADPRHNIFDIVIVGNAHVGELFAADTATNFDGGTPFYLQVKDLTARRWGDALTVLASLVWSAWAEAGSPQLPGFGAGCSMAAPTAEIVLVGFPVPGGFFHEDGGAPSPDAGGLDSGVIDAGVGGGGGGGSGGGAGGGESPPSSCNCGVPGTALLGAVALLFARARRR